MQPDEIASKLGSLDTCLKGLCADIAAIRTRLEDVIRLEGRVDRHEDAMHRIGAEVDRLEERQRRMEGEVATIRADVGHAQRELGPVPDLVTKVTGNTQRGAWLWSLMLLVLGALLGAAMNAITGG